MIENEIENIINTPDNSVYLFMDNNQKITNLEEETYIVQALWPAGIKHGYQRKNEDTDFAFIARWPEDKFPLKVYGGADFGYLFSPIELKLLDQSVQNALKRISYVNPACFKFEMVKNRHEANIIIKFRRTDKFVSSHCCPEIGKEKQILHADIVVNIPKNFTGEQVAHSRVSQDLLHNLLHAMGIYGHSENKIDSAFKEWAPQQQVLTQRDTATLNLLYRCPLAITRKELMLLWKDYQNNKLALSVSESMEEIMAQLYQYEKDMMSLPKNVLTKSNNLSGKELALQQSFNKYIKKIGTA